jgi:hypothetical protein
MIADDRFGVVGDGELALLAEELDLGQERLGHRARADPDRLEALHRREHQRHVLERDTRRVGDLGIGLGEEPVRVERADDVVGHVMEARGEEGMEVPGQVVLEREVGLCTSDRVELVRLVAEPGGPVAGQVVGTQQASAVVGVVALPRHALGAVVAGHRAAADRAGRQLGHL